MKVSEEALDFLTGVHGNREDNEKRKEKIFNRAFELAYKDMATHTVAYTEKAKQDFVGNDSKRCNDNKIKIRNAIKEYVKGKFFGDSSLVKSISSKEAFDNWHASACKRLVDIDCVVDQLKNKENNKIDATRISDLLRHTDPNITKVFTYGQAQKLINMMVKYLYIFYQCEGWNDLEHLKDFAHVPIDSYVLNEVFGKEVYNGTPWSKFEKYDDYKECKEKIDDKAVGTTPFLWELANWPFNN